MLDQFVASGRARLHVLREEPYVHSEGSVCKMVVLEALHACLKEDDR